MASIEAETATLSVDEIAAMSDTELGQFMTKHRRPDGGYELPVDGWDKLSKDERNNLAERLKAQERGLAQSPTACSRPLDLDDLDARLRQVPASNSFSLRPEPQATDIERPDLVDLEFTRTRYEIEFYHELISDGGRPLYPIDLIREVFRNPDNYAAILRPWQESLTQIHPERIFQRQLRRWQDFRKWQNDNRGREDDDGGFPAYVEREKYEIQRDYLPGLAAKHLAKIQADPACLRSDWDQMQLLRRRQRRLYREHGCDGLRDYADAVKYRLARHDFTLPLEFKLAEDPKHQDKLTTWIEYLNYEYWWLDKHTSDIERLGPVHDKAWQELVDEKVPRPHETKGFVRTDISAMERENEMQQAQKAVERAESEAKNIYALTQEDPQRLRIPRAKRISMLENGSTKLIAAKRRFQQISSRNLRIIDFVRGTGDYADAKRNATRQQVLVQWVLEEVPLIKAEMAQSKAAKVGPGQTTRSKRRLTADEEPLGERSPKRPKPYHQELGPPTSSSGPRVPSKAKSEPLAVTD
ncbi:hypothetical protein F5X99DRAFT_409373 [Biscogniauxia marginata]|nr:hypothetical protein F5X99DRAFT_409373 [Biscogniauxia marginata]